MDFHRAAASIANLLSALSRSLQLSGRAQSLLNSKVSLPCLSVLTGREGYNLGGLAGARSWKCCPEASATRIGACQGGGSMTSGRAGGGAVAAAGTSPGPGSGIAVASGPGGALGGGHIIIQYGGRAGHPCPNPARSQREKGDRRVCTCRSARPNQNTTWSKAVSPLKSILPWWT